MENTVEVIGGPVHGCKRIKGYPALITHHRPIFLRILQVSRRINTGMEGRVGAGWMNHGEAVRIRDVHWTKQTTTKLWLTTTLRRLQYQLHLPLPPLAFLHSRRIGPCSSGDSERNSATLHVVIVLLGWAMKLATTLLLVER